MSKALSKPEKIRMDKMLERGWPFDWNYKLTCMLTVCLC